MGLLSAGKTDIGKKRSTNQDSIYLSTKKNLFIVADGMGGHNGGDIASQMAIDSIPKFYMSNPKLSPEELGIKSTVFANESIKNHAKNNPKLIGMGTTLLGLKFKGDTVYISNVGDSRAYLVNHNKIFQLSVDHSLVQEKLKLGIYDREMARNDKEKNILVRAVGFEDKLEVDLFTYKVSRNDIFLACSDGLHGKVSDADILYLINKYIPIPASAKQEDLQDLVEALVQQANDNGGQDNISVIIVLAQ